MESYVRPRHTVAIDHHEHASVADSPSAVERATWRVIALTLAMMVAEIIAGRVFNSMALLADGWHMGSHAAALGITAFAYSYARRHHDNERYAFGTWKVGALGGFTSAVGLGLVAVLLAWESAGRLARPSQIAFDQAILVALLGLAVNLVSAWMLHGHDHDGGHDHNLRAAYAHVLTDALTSLLAIVALLGGRFFGWVWMDPMMGIVGAAIIARWAFGLIRDTARVLLDSDVEPRVAFAVRQAIESHDDNQVIDLHIWRVGPRGLSAIISLATHDPRPPEHYKQLVAGVFDLTHLTIEVNRCADDDCGSRPE